MTGNIKIQPGGLTSFWWLIIVIVIKEMIIGFFIGICFAMIFWSIDSVGQIIDSMRGATISSIFNPMLNESTSITGSALYYFLSVAFIVCGGVNVILSIIFDSYYRIDVTSFDITSSDYKGFVFNLWECFIYLFLAFSLPFITIFSLCDIALSFINRMSPQLNAFSLSLPIKSIVSAFLLAIVVNTYPHTIILSIDNAKNNIYQHLIISNE